MTGLDGDDAKKVSRAPQTFSGPRAVRDSGSALAQLV
jgi:hypothetical protein